MTMPDGRPDAGLIAQAAAEAHLDACQAAEYAFEESGDETIASPAVGPYCGCGTCDVRETLAAAWPVIVADCAELLERAEYPGAAKVLRAEAARTALPHTPLHSEGVHA